MLASEIITTVVRDVYQAPEAFVPLYVPTFSGNEKQYLIECIDSTFVSSVGQFVDAFEEKIAQYTGAKHAVVCVNGTNALHLSLLLVGVEKDDLVITQPLTFIATANAISYTGASPVFVDVDKDTMGLSPTALENYLNNEAELKSGVCYHKASGRKISACMPMHTFGHACRIEEIIEICHRFNIKVAEDAAEAMGSFYKGKHLGTFAEIAAVSFNGNKVITAGGGGVILTNNSELAKKAKHLTTQAKVPHAWEFNHDAIGYNYRMPNINAALALAQLEQLPDFLSKKRKITEAYKAHFKKHGIAFFDEREQERCNFWLNAIVAKDKQERDQILEDTNTQGVMTRPIWQLMTKLPMFEHCYQGDVSNAQWLEERVVNIPSSVK